MNKKKLIFIVGGIVVALIIGALIFIESISEGKIGITNKTDADIDRIYVCLEDDDDGEYFTLFDGKVASGESASKKLEELDCTGYGLRLTIFLTFKDKDEMWITDGFFNEIFKGDIDLDFYQKDGEYCLKAKAGQGLFGHTGRTKVDTKFVLDLDNADWDYDTE